MAARLPVGEVENIVLSVSRLGFAPNPANRSARSIRARGDVGAGLRVKEMHRGHIEFEWTPFALLWKIIR
ncbi:MAG: hypothetical protein ABSE69_00490, partial [Roseiarcus sp.]